MDLHKAISTGLVCPDLFRRHIDNPRTLKNRETKIPNPQSRGTKVCKLRDKNTKTVDTYGVCHQLAPVTETVSASCLLSKNNLDQTIESEGAYKRIHLEEGGNFKVTEGATNNCWTYEHKC